MPVSSDALEQGRKIFVEEAREKLEELQEALMALEESPGERELVDQAFRALHTIKGSGSMFGFDKIAGFTHKVESTFDAVREGRLEVTPPLIEASLEAHDQIADLLNQALAGEEPDPAPVEALIARFEQLLPGPADANLEQPRQAEPRPEGPVREFLVTFKPNRQIWANGTKILPLLDELQQMGSCRIVTQSEDLPPLAELDPESCYLGWEVHLSTEADENAIRDVFIFVEDEAQLSVRALDPPEPRLTATEDSPPSASPPAEQASQPPSREVQVLKQAVQAGASIKVASSKLDKMVDLVGELVTAQARLQRLAGRETDGELAAVSEEIETLTADLRDTTMNMRMVAIGSTFNRFKRLVRDLSANLPQSARLETSGGETELDKSMIDRLADPLVHIIRNSIDHGIEPPEDRTAAGKDPEGTVRLSAQHVAGQVLVSISDDGKGLSAQQIRVKAESRGLIAPNAELTERELFGLVFAPGFSTKEKVTSVSGRGVGMDVVKRSVEALRGTVDIDSETGRGTQVTLRLPLTMAIIDGLLVKIDGEPYVLPLSSIEECVELTREEVQEARGRNLAVVRGDLVPYIHLRQVLEFASPLPPIQHLVVAEVEGRRVGFVVDSVVGGHQTVIKSLGRYFEQLKNLSGATILGDGSVALILDLNRLVEQVETLRGGAHV